MPWVISRPSLVRWEMLRRQSLTNSWGLESIQDWSTQRATSLLAISILNSNLRCLSLWINSEIWKVKKTIEILLLWRPLNSLVANAGEILVSPLTNRLRRINLEYLLWVGMEILRKLLRLIIAGCLAQLLSALELLVFNLQWVCTII
jgi:hypothetical protein